ncbi:hypothetical protein A3A14_02195 [Candidatus Daviesbacteria bacterium RIFCSPLOWO2_01_FULL_43_38]|uniref:Uncharacterized protein n=1 Tax=Candidatus Daviesbacteria bacterium RIFCSPHIGHO2_12_FULL_43_11 TaxID=1797780 RepID=A0A1F5K3I2_9BACT|nr:MAG: hypothetical protein A2874_04190 [Candidatus Daviesbacteria bacterium RIFCSPHIGHO2_01_FULL_43_17]OGE35533.1 MAG: hypothetical protein A3E45_02595 [Candidatus Daviesbacteria bacterium RIFCSPHIGHO2_12_FULL_43_11]OGE63847.1 MAG: hypothetical protein A3A14_02195 [Candidatus Daviesbacteria bacterium RIFCSPLOWO2_01_FULL_43_38]
MKEQDREDENMELKVSKPNRRKNQEAAKSAQVIHPHLVFYEREELRQEREKKTNIFVKKARKQAKRGK